MNYAEMSDFEINMSVSKLTGTYRYIDSNPEGSKHLGRNYCNSWADAGPIIEQSRIGIEHDGDCWLCTCFSENGAFESENDKPLRAAMIVFLMMKESKK